MEATNEEDLTRELAGGGEVWRLHLRFPSDGDDRVERHACPGACRLNAVAWRPGKYSATRAGSLREIRRGTVLKIRQNSVIHFILEDEQSWITVIQHGMLSKAADRPGNRSVNMAHRSCAAPWDRLCA